MRFGDAAMDEVYQRWIALCDRAWRRKHGRLVLVLGVVFAVSSVVGFLLMCQYLGAVLSAATGNAAPQLSPNNFLAGGLFAFASVALPAGLIYGVLRARQAELPDEFALALDSNVAFKMKLNAMRRSMYSTVLPIALIPVTIQAIYSGTSKWLISAINVQQAGSGHVDYLYVSTVILWNLLLSIGWLVCLLEWQAILLSRIPAGAQFAWLHAVPYLLPVFSDLIALIGGVYCFYIVRSRIQPANIPDEQNTIFILAFITALITLILAPLIWRWASAAVSPARWIVVCVICALAMSNSYQAYNKYNPYYKAMSPFLVIAAAGNGIYLGNHNAGFFMGDMEKDNPLTYDLLGISLYKQGSISPKLRGPGVVLAHNFYLPWYVAIIWLVLYYAYSFLILRGAAQIMPAGGHKHPHRR